MSGQREQLQVYIQAKQELLCRFLDQNLPDAHKESERILEAMRYSLFGGKYLRSILIFMIHEMFDGKEAQALHSASAIELVHTYSLIHDDLPALDNDTMRRGQESTHKKYGEALAILTGDACLTFAFELLSQAHLDPKLIVRIIKELSFAAGTQGMIGGQVADILYTHASFKNNPEAKSDVLEYIHLHKTGALIQAAIVIGALTAGVCSETILEKLRECGFKIGLAFQIVDDILDQEGTQKCIGKSIGKDKASDKLTYPSLYGLEYSKKHSQALLDESIQILAENNANDLLKTFLNTLIHRYC